MVTALVDRSRGIQGWTLLGPKAAHPIGMIWTDELDRVGIATEDIDAAFARAVDCRVELLAKGREAPPLGVELVIAMARRIREEKGVIDSREAYRLQLQARIADLKRTGAAGAVIAEYEKELRDYE